MTLTGPRIRLALPMLAISLTVMSTWGQEAGAPRRNRSAIETHRPLRDFAGLIEARHGVIVTYEDPIYNVRHEAKDESVRPDLGPALVPRPHRLRLPTAWDAPALSPADLLAVLEAGVQNEVGPPATRFKVERGRIEGVFHIVPTHVLNDHGTAERHPAVLDTLVTVEGTNMPAWECLTSILQQVSSKSGVKVSFATVPRGKGRPVTMTMRDQPARDVLSRLLIEDRVLGLGLRVTWNLYYDVGDRDFWLNIVAPGDTLDVRFVSMPPE